MKNIAIQRLIIHLLSHTKKDSLNKKHIIPHIQPIFQSIKTYINNIQRNKEYNKKSISSILKPLKIKKIQKNLLSILLKIYKYSVLKKIQSIKDIFKVLPKKFKNSNYENLCLILLNKNQYVIKKIFLYSKKKNKISLKINKIIHMLIQYTPSYLFIIHTHPTDKINPSPNDIQSTKLLLLICQIFKIKLIDHIILQKEKYFSFEEKNLLEKYLKEILHFLK